MRTMVVIPTCVIRSAVHGRLTSLVITVFFALLPVPKKILLAISWILSRGASRVRCCLLYVLVDKFEGFAVYSTGAA